MFDAGLWVVVCWTGWRCLPCTWQYPLALEDTTALRGKRWLEEKFLPDMTSGMHLHSKAQGFPVPLFQCSARDFSEAIGTAP